MRGALATGCDFPSCYTRLHESWPEEGGVLQKDAPITARIRYHIYSAKRTPIGSTGKDLKMTT